MRSMIRELEPFAYGDMNCDNEDVSAKIAEGLYTLCECAPRAVGAEPTERVLRTGIRQARVSEA